MIENHCPCGSGLGFENCCEPIINSKKDAITAEQLMRSRYTAFTLANGNYLMKSHHSSTRPNGEQRSIEIWASSVNWVALSVLNTEKGQENDKDGIVEFRAVYSENGSIKQIHERSKFVREKGKWTYISGDHY